MSEPTVPRCHSARDGECIWDECPQEKNNRANYQSYCPLAAAWEAYWEDQGIDYR